MAVISVSLPDIRLLRYRSHVVFYRVEEDTVKAVRIPAGKQNWIEHI
jgi:plasmid stabilization system protein ParE